MNISKWADDNHFLFCTRCGVVDIEANREERDKHYKLAGIVGYQRIYHAREVTNRLQCIEPNKPDSEMENS